MKRIHDASKLLATLLTLTAPVFGCEQPDCSDADCGPGGAGGTGGQLVGGDGGSGGDTSSSSGGSGGSAPRMTRVHVLDDSGTAVADADVIVNDAAGDLVVHALTSAAGEVDVMVPEQGSVSLVFTRVREGSNPLQQEHRVETVRFVSAAPADVRILQVDYPPAQPQPSMVLELAWPARQGAVGYVLRPGCMGVQNTSGTSATIPMKDCAGTGLYEIVVLAIGVNGVPIDIAYLVAQPFVEGTTVPHTLLWKHETPVSVPFQLVNVPGDADTVAIETWSHATTASAVSSANFAPGLSSYSLDLPQFASFPAVHCREAAVGFGTSSASRRECAPAPIEAELSFDPTRLARFESVVQLAPLTVEATQLTTGEQGDAVLLEVKWDADDGAPTVWTVQQDAAATGAVPFPTMPAELATYGLEPVIELVTSSSATHQDELGVTGFDAAISSEAPFSFWNDSEGVRTTTLAQ